MKSQSVTRGWWIIEIAYGVNHSGGCTRWFTVTNWDLEEIDVYQRQVSLETCRAMNPTTLHHVVKWVKRLHENKAYADVEIAHSRLRNVKTEEIIHGAVL